MSDVNEDTSGPNLVTVGRVSDLTGLSVRTLHHFDEIGLVVPSARTPVGYRGYTDTDCTPQTQLRLTEMYVADDRFRAYYDGAKPGLAQWLRDVVIAYAPEPAAAPDE